MSQRYSINELLLVIYGETLERPFANYIDQLFKHMNSDSKYIAMRIANELPVENKEDRVKRFVRKFRSTTKQVIDYKKVKADYLKLEDGYCGIFRKIEEIK